MLPENFTGADFSALTSEAYMSAVKRKIDIIKNEIKEFNQGEMTVESFF
jgi:SpoVK/Ycf46/Vps4 family AAA+-type ATPase